MQQEQRKVGFLLGIGILFIPIIFGWFLLRKGYSKKARIWGLGYLALMSFIMFSRDRESSFSTPATQINDSVSNIDSSPKPEPSTVKTVNTDKYAGKIEADALLPYTAKGGFEKTIRKYKPRLKEITTYRRQAAEKAIDSGKCDSVIASELSDKSTLKNLNFWVDCNNGERIYLDENQLKNGGEVITQQELAVSKSDAMKACEKAIKSDSPFPSSVDIHHLSGVSYYEAPTTHNVTLEIDFDAKNVLGNEVPQKAICNFPIGEDWSIKIEPR